ncbi:MAG TPA: chloride channel protein [Blastococcus sp.]|nr:chloride channel protein [Blastococcus sp.]
MAADHGAGRDGRPPAAADPLAVMRSRAYLRLLVLAVMLGVPIAAAAFWFLKLTDLLQHWAFVAAPEGLGFSAAPLWWPLVPLAAAGLLVGLTIRYLPGHGGESPADGFTAGGFALPVTLPGIALAAVASIGLGAVIGPEAPLIALGGGLAYLAVRLGRKDVPRQTAAVVAATGSFAAISTLLGTPLAGAFLLMEAASAGGMLATAVLLPGLLGAGVGSLIFTGLDALTGYGTFSLAIPGLPKAGAPTFAEFGWAVGIGLVAAVLCVGLRWLARRVRDSITGHLVLGTVLLGLAIAGFTILYAWTTGHAAADVLFSGQTALPHVVDTQATYSVGALTLLLACKGLAYVAALGGFRGGPTFPAMFLGAVGGIALSHLPGLPLVAGVAMGLGAMTAGLLRLPMTAVLLATLLLGSDAFPVIPVVIVAVVVCYITVLRLSPGQPAPTPSPQAHTPAPDGDLPTPRHPEPPAGPAPAEPAADQPRPAQPFT